MRGKALFIGASLLLASCVSGADSGVGEAPGVVAQSVTNGWNDVDTPAANVVVMLANYSPVDGALARFCSGTLITPKAVLTAKHCITGSVSDGVLTPTALPITVCVGNHSPACSANTAHLNGAIAVYGGSGPLPLNTDGADLAVVFLTTPVFDAAIVRPSLSPPAPYDVSDDVNGGNYSNMFVSGWSPFGSVAYRQVASVSALNHSPELPSAGDGTASGQIWVRQQTGTHLQKGDSGGPLYHQRPDGTRDVIGVASGGVTGELDVIDCPNTCDVWTDVTRGAPRDWLIATMKETRTPTWLARHGRSDYWTGEVDYQGACRPWRDADCDHWFDEHDNCPVTPNLEQYDLFDTGIGDACKNQRSWSDWGTLGGADDGVTVARTANGRLEFFAHDVNDGHIYTKSQTWSSPPWTEWARVGSLETMSAPAVVPNADGRLELFAVAVETRELMHASELAPGTGNFGDWESLGGYCTSDPAAGVNLDGRVEVFVRGGEGSVWNRWQLAPNQDSWGGWGNLEGYIQGAPSVTSDQDGRLEVFVRGGENALWHKMQTFADPPWTGWRWLGGNLAGDPVATRNPDGRIEVFAVQGDGSLANRWQTLPNYDGWGGWGSMAWPGAPLDGVSKPAVTETDRGLSVFLRATDGTLWRRDRDGGWGNWQSMNRFLSAPPAVALNLDGRIEVFTIGPDFSVSNRWQQ